MTAALALGASPAMFAVAQQDEGQLEEIVVRTRQTQFAHAEVNTEKLARVAPISSPLASVSSLPGVLVGEGDQFGGDDWSTFISMRGFQTNLDEQQIGMTIDGIPNGNSNYGGGAKANRYIDTPNLATVRVSQGTADIASRSNEALGGTLDFVTNDPLDELRLRTSFTLGEYEAGKVYARIDSGLLFDDTTRAYLSHSESDNKTWIDKSGGANRSHTALKFITELERLTITGYLSVDDVQEDNYQRISLAQFEEDPGWDRLTGDWSGIPHIDQAYRRGWKTLRDNTLGYLKFDFETGPIGWKLNAYYHDNDGRGDWLPPYVVNVTDDGDGPESELSNVTVTGGEPLGRLYFLDNNGYALSPEPGCTISIHFPYGGPAAEGDPACHDSDAVPAGSYRHSHYGKQRFGFNADLNWVTQLGDSVNNSLRAGLWWEDYERDEARDWHRISDSRIGFSFEEIPYWTQYNRSYRVDTLMYYVADTVEAGLFTLSLGVRKFLVELEREDNFSGEGSGVVDSDSDALLSGAVAVDIPVIPGLALFAGYAENFAAVKDEALEREASALEDIDPETAENMEFGLRYHHRRLSATLTWYQVRFENRLTFVPPDTPLGVDFLQGTTGAYINLGGIDSSGIEVAGTFRFNDNWLAYASFTDNDSRYEGSGDPALDRSQGALAGNGVAGAVDNMLSLAIDWNHGSYRAGVTYRRVGGRWLDGANRERVPGYELVDVSAGIRAENPGGFLKAVDLSIAVNNVLDEEYLGGITNGAAWIGPHSNAALSLMIDF